MNFETLADAENFWAENLRPELGLAYDGDSRAWVVEDGD